MTLWVRRFLPLICLVWTIATASLMYPLVDDFQEWLWDVYLYSGQGYWERVGQTAALFTSFLTWIGVIVWGVASLALILPLACPIAVKAWTKSRDAEDGSTP